MTSLRLLTRLVGRCGQLALSILLALWIAACQQPATDPLPTDPTKPGSVTLTQPGNTTTTQPGNTTTTPGSSTTTQPADTVKAAKRVKISWSANDFQELLYDAAGRPTQYASQYVDNLGTGHVRRTVYKLGYSVGNQLTRVDITYETGTHYVLYQYKGDQVSQTDQYTANGTLLTTCTYQYSAPNQLSQVDEHYVGGKPTRRTYQYDARGNLSALGVYIKSEATGTYTLEYTIHYEDYDNQPDVENLLYHVPLLPGIRFRVNNHRLKIVRDRDGRELSRDQFTYVYNERGYPVEQVRRGPGGTLIATYTY